MKLTKYIVAALKENDEVKVHANEICNHVVERGIRNPNYLNSEILEWKTAITKLGARRIFRQMDKKYNPSKSILQYSYVISRWWEKL